MITIMMVVFAGIVIVGVASFIIFMIVSLINRMSMSPLMKAASRGQTDECRRLIKSGVPVDEKTKFGDTALILAAGKGWLETVSYLISEGADVNHDGLHSTPLVAAARRGQTQVVRVLVENNADVNCHDSTGKTALHQSIISNNRDVFDFLLGKGAKIDNRAVIESLGINVEKSDREGYFITKLLQNGANPNVIHDGYGATTIMYAAQQQKIGVVKLLIERGANVNARTKNGNSVLHCTRFNAELKQILTDAGAR